MKLVALTDIHGKMDGFEQIAETLQAADLILLTGDITNFGWRSRHVARVLDAIKNFNTRILAVPGNCDTEVVANYFDKTGINLHGAVKSVGGIDILGLGGSIPCPGHTPNEYSENEMDQILHLAARDLSDEKQFLMVSHQPPFGTLVDQTGNGKNVGSHAVRRFIEIFQPRICFTGHIHEGVGTDKIGETQIINPGPFSGGGYTYAEIDKKVRKLEIRSWKQK